MKNLIAIIAAAFLFSALIDGLPYGFFFLLRLIVCSCSVLISWQAYRFKKVKWVGIYIFIALLFNPLIPIHLSREVWGGIDFAVGVFFVFTVFLLKLKKIGNLYE